MSQQGALGFISFAPAVTSQPCLSGGAGSEPWRGLASSQSALLIATQLYIRGWWPVPWGIPFSP